MAMPGLHIEAKNIIFNFARRTSAKLASNSTLGKLSQAENRRISKFVCSWQELSKLRFDSHVVMYSVNPVTEYHCEVSYIRKDETLGAQLNANVILYSMVTAKSRITMFRDYQMLLKNGCTCYYTDTDSVVLSYPNRATKERVHKLLSVGGAAYGQYKQENKKEGVLLGFATLGAKNYALQYESGCTMTKVRGFTLKSHYSKNKLSFDTVHEMVCSWMCGVSKTVEVDTFHMQIERATMKIRSGVHARKYSNMTNTKRMLLDHDIASNPTCTTVPYGAKHSVYSDVSP